MVGGAISPDNSREDRTGEESRRKRAMAAAFGAGADPSTLPTSFLDEAIKDGDIEQKTLWTERRR